MNKKLYRIGEISKICNIPIKTLRYYDDISLLQPARIDEKNNYRYYSKEQILIINLIRDLKLAGFSLEEIKPLLKREDMSMLCRKLEERLAHIDQTIKELEHTRSKIKNYYELLSKGNNILECKEEIEVADQQMYNIEKKSIPLSWVVYTRYRCPCNPGAFTIRYSQLYNLIEKHNLHRVGALKAIYHDHYTKFDRNNADIEVCLPIAERIEIPSLTKEFGGYLAVTTLHKGSYLSMIEAYKALMNWIEQKNYVLSGPAVENYIIDAGSTSYEENYVTEVILPIRKKI